MRGMRYSYESIIHKPPSFVNKNILYRNRFKFKLWSFILFKKKQENYVKMFIVRSDNYAMVSLCFD